MKEDPIAFLRARWDERLQQLEEDEQIALAAVGTGVDSRLHWVVDRAFYPPTPYIRALGIYASPFRQNGHTDPAQLEHIARWDPANVLELIRRERAGIETKRKILSQYEFWLPREGDSDDHDHVQTAADSAAALFPVINLLVAGERA